MVAKPEDLSAFLRQLGIETHTIDHPPLFTVEQSQALRGKIPGAHVKNLFLKDKKGALFLVVAREDLAIDLKHLHRKIGATGRLSFASADLLLETLGVTPGAVTAFGLINDGDGRVSVVLDEGLMASDRINCHPLVNTATTMIATADLLAFIEATGHLARIVELDEADAAAGLRHGGGDTM